MEKKAIIFNRYIRINCLRILINLKYGKSIDGRNGKKEFYYKIMKFKN